MRKVDEDVEGAVLKAVVDCASSRDSLKAALSTSEASFLAKGDLKSMNVGAKRSVS